jgi:hypothetical protein
MGNRTQQRNAANLRIFSQRQKTVPPEEFLPIDGPIKFAYQQSIEDAQRWLSRTLRISHVDFTGLSLEMANLFNKTLVGEYNFLPFELEDVSSIANSNYGDLDKYFQGRLRGAMMFTNGRNLIFDPEGMESAMKGTVRPHGSNAAQRRALDRDLRERVTDDDLRAMVAKEKRLGEEIAQLSSIGLEIPIEEIPEGIRGRIEDGELGNWGFLGVIDSIPELAALKSRLNADFERVTEPLAKKSFERLVIANRIRNQAYIDQDRALTALGRETTDWALKQLKLEHIAKLEDSPEFNSLWNTGGLATRPRDFYRLTLLHELGHIRERKYLRQSLAAEVFPWLRRDPLLGKTLPHEFLQTLPPFTRYGETDHQENFAEYYSVYRMYPELLPTAIKTSMDVFLGVAQS